MVCCRVSFLSGELPLLCVFVYVCICICVFVYLYNVHREEWSVAECSLIWMERSSFYPQPPNSLANPENSLFPRRWLLIIFLSHEHHIFIWWSYLIIVSSSEWRGPPSTPSPQTLQRTLRILLFLIPRWLLYDDNEEDHHIFIRSSSSWKWRGPPSTPSPPTL